MKLYHGSNVRVTIPDLSRSKPYKDFGQGFYLSDNYEQAKNLAETKVEQMRSGIAVVNEFAFDEGILTSEELHISLQRLVEELKYAKGITFQYFFGTERALQKLKAL